MTASPVGPLPDPPRGHAFWFDLRGNNCSGPGTYDSGDPAQVGSRDAEINKVERPPEAGAPGGHNRRRV